MEPNHVWAVTATGSRLWAAGMVRHNATDITVRPAWQGLHPRRAETARSKKRYGVVGRTTPSRTLRAIFALDSASEARVVTAFDQGKQPRKR